MGVNRVAGHSVSTHAGRTDAVGRRGAILTAFNNAQWQERDQFGTIHLAHFTYVPTEW